jgi:heptosyltransferase-2
VPDAWQAQAGALLTSHGIATDRVLIGVAPGAAYGSAKQWTPAGVAEVLAGCGPHVAVVLLGSRGDAAAAAAIEGALADLSTGATVRNVIGLTDMPTLVALLARCRALLCNDSGAMHLASVLGVPVVATFGPTDEFATTPMGPHHLLVGNAWCRPCLRRTCPLDHRCMTTIPADDVLRALEPYLRHRSSH